MNIVFDLGGVVVTWKPEAIIANVFADPAVREIVRKEVFEHPDWPELDRGTLPWHDAVARAAQRSGLPAADVARLLREVPPSLKTVPETVDLMYRLKAGGHTLYCLSNMHIASIDYLEQHCTFWDVFAGKVISCRVNLCKPEPAIYAHLLDTHGLEPRNTVFIDDVQVNLDAARQFGIRTIQFLNASQCDQELAQMGCA
jgi:putative hydrolase of the HAD superfamily